MTLSQAETSASSGRAREWELLWQAKTADNKEAAHHAADLVLLLRPKAYSLAYRLMQDHSLAEDVVQEAFIRLWKSSADDTGQAALGTYFHRIVFNESMRALQQHQRESPFDHASITSLIEAQQQPEAEEELHLHAMPGLAPKHLEAAIAALPPRQRAALLLWAYEDMDVKDIAVALEIAENAAHQLLFRAKQALKKQLKASHHEHSTAPV